MLSVDLPELGVVRIAKPCPQKWADMKGDAQVRLCAACKCKVFNFAKLSSEEARQLIRKNSEGVRICARIFRRLDGTVMTKDCARGYSYGWRFARKVMPSAAGLGLIAVVLLALAVGTVTYFGDNIRRLFATTTGCALGAADTVQTAPPPVFRPPLGTDGLHGRLVLLPYPPGNKY